MSFIANASAPDEGTEDDTPQARAAASLARHHKTLDEAFAPEKQDFDAPDPVPAHINEYLTRPSGEARRTAARDVLAERIRDLSREVEQEERRLVHAVLSIESRRATRDELMSAFTALGPAEAAAEPTCADETHLHLTSSCEVQDLEERVAKALAEFSAGINKRLRGLA